MRNSRSRAGRGRSRRLLSGIEARTAHHPPRRLGAGPDRPTRRCCGASRIFTLQGQQRAMPNLTHAARAYEASSNHRSPREQEADVFRRANGALKAARVAEPISRTRALSDNRLLWLAVDNLMRDPMNALPQELRASI